LSIYIYKLYQEKC